MVRSPDIETRADASRPSSASPPRERGARAWSDRRGAEGDAATGGAGSAWSRFQLLWRTHSGAELARLGVPRAESMRIDPALVIAAVLINLLGLAMPLAVLQIYDRIAPMQAYETLFTLTLGLLAVGVAEFGLRIAQGYIANLSASRFGHTLQVLTMRRLLAADLKTRSDLRQSAVLEQLKAVDKLTAYYGGHPRLALIDLPFAMIFIVTIFLIAGPLALAPIVVMSIFLVQVVWLGRRNKEIAEARDEQDGRTVDFLGEVLSGGFTIKSFAIEIVMLRRFERLLKRSAGLQRDAVALLGDLQRTSTIFGNASMVTMVSIGGLFVIWGDLSIGGLAACSMLAGRAAQPVLKAANAWNELERATVAVAKVGELFQLPERPAAPSAVARTRAPEVAARGLGLARGDRTLVRDAEFLIEPGSTAALVGPDGAGRSTLLWTLAGLGHPACGALEIDGAPAALYRRSRDARVAVYTPTIAPLTGTVLQNLTLFGRGATVEEARWATRLLGVEEMINVLPEGYDTMLGAGVAETLPAGLSRRLMLARAVAQKPRLLLLDRPEAYLDEDSVAHLLAALRALRGHVTVVVASTHPRQIAQSDIALVFRDGRIHETAPLAALKGIVRGRAPGAAADETAGGAA